jgi:hypothetical protein
VLFVLECVLSVMLHDGRSDSSMQLVQLDDDGPTQLPQLTCTLTSAAGLLTVHGHAKRASLTVRTLPVFV